MIMMTVVEMVNDDDNEDTMSLALSWAFPIHHHIKSNLPASPISFTIIHLLLSTSLATIPSHAAMISHLDSCDSLLNVLPVVNLVSTISLHYRHQKDHLDSYLRSQHLPSCLNPPVVSPHLDWNPTSLPQLTRPYGIWPHPPVRPHLPASLLLVHGAPTQPPFHPDRGSLVAMTGHVNWLFSLPPNLSRTGSFLSLRHQLTRLVLRGAFPDLPATVDPQPPSLSLIPRLATSRPNCISVDLLLFTISRLVYNSVKTEIFVPHVCCFITSTSNSAQHWMEPNKYLLSYLIYSSQERCFRHEVQLCNLQWHTPGCMSSKRHLTPESTPFIPVANWLSSLHLSVILTLEYEDQKIFPVS